MRAKPGFGRTWWGLCLAQADGVFAMNMEMGERLQARDLGLEVPTNFVINTDEEADYFWLRKEVRSSVFVSFLGME